MVKRKITQRLEQMREDGGKYAWVSRVRPSKPPNPENVIECGELKLKE